MSPPTKTVRFHKTSAPFSEVWSSWDGFAYCNNVIYIFMQHNLCLQSIIQPTPPVFPLQTCSPQLASVEKQALLSLSSEKELYAHMFVCFLQHSKIKWTLLCLRLHVDTELACGSSQTKCSMAYLRTRCLPRTSTWPHLFSWHVSTLFVTMQQSTQISSCCDASQIKCSLM